MHDTDELGQLRHVRAAGVASLTRAPPGSRGTTALWRCAFARRPRCDRAWAARHIRTASIASLTRAPSGSRCTKAPWRRGFARRSRYGRAELVAFVPPASPFRRGLPRARTSSQRYSAAASHGVHGTVELSSSRSCRWRRLTDAGSLGLALLHSATALRLRTAFTIRTSLDSFVTFAPLASPR